MGSQDGQRPVHRDGTIWLATEYIAQTCTLSEWSADSTCGGTRTVLANWSTFVEHVSGN